MPGPYFQRTPWVAAMHQDSAYTLAHLDEYQVVVTDSAGTSRTIAISFSDHCFTRKPRSGDAPEHAYPGCSRNPGYFCLDRYNHSLNVRAHLQYAMGGEAWSLQSDNYAAVPTVTHNGTPVLYGIVFSLDRVKGLPVDLHMRIATAHPRDEREIVTFGSVRFSHLVTLRMQNRRPPRNYRPRRRKPMLI